MRLVILDVVRVDWIEIADIYVSIWSFQTRQNLCCGNVAFLKNAPIAIPVIIKRAGVIFVSLNHHQIRPLHFSLHGININLAGEMK